MTSARVTRGIYVSARVRVAVALALLGAGCSSGADSAPPPPGPRDPVGVDAGARDAVVRDAEPYERPPASASVTGHPWLWRDVGGDKGDLRFGTSTLTARAGGAGLDGVADGMGLVATGLHGDGEIVARVRSLQMADARSTAGVMIRADGEPGAASVFVGILAEVAKGGRIVVRKSAGAAAESFANDVQIRAGQFLRIKREGRRFSIFRSPDRLGWVKLGAVEVDMPEGVIAGVAVSAGRAGATTTAEIDQLRLLEIDESMAGAGFDVETISGVGAKVSAAGGAVNFSGASDPFVTTAELGTALVAPVVGAQTLTAKIEALGAPKAKIGLMIREGGPGRVSSTARHALIAIDATGKLTFQRRDRSTNFEAVGMREGLKFPVWLRLARYDDPTAFRTRVRTWYSSDGASYTPLGTVELALADPVLAGLMFTSGDSRTHTTAKVSGFALTAGSEPIEPPSGQEGGAGLPDAGPRPLDAGGGS